MEGWRSDVEADKAATKTEERARAAAREAHRLVTTTAYRLQHAAKAAAFQARSEYAEIHYSEVVLLAEAALVQLRYAELAEEGHR